MDAILLAAGLGTRLRPYTESTPKPLLPVQGRPILDWTLGALPAAVDRILVVVNYLAEQFEAYLKQQSHFRHWQTVRQEQPRGTGDALRTCRSHLRSGSFLVLNGDDLFGATDLAELVRHPAALLVHPVEEPRKFGIAYQKPDGTLDRLVEKPPLEGVQLANTGAYTFPAHVFDTELQLSERGEYEITDYVSALARQGTVQLVQAKFWFPIGTVDAWRAAEKLDLSEVLAGHR
jgi:NDP-sugar pyrophosphorylase family protein